MKRVVVKIDRLVLQGFAQAERLQIAQGLQDELSRVLAQGDAVRQLTRLGNVPRLDGGTVHVPRGSRANRVGSGIARAIGRSVKP